MYVVTVLCNRTHSCILLEPCSCVILEPCSCILLELHMLLYYIQCCGWVVYLTFLTGAIRTKHCMILFVRVCMCAQMCQLQKMYNGEYKIKS